MLLVGDIGGTKTELAVYETGSMPGSPLLIKQFHSADYPNLQAIARQFLREAQTPVTHSIIGVAGPVINGRIVPDMGRLGIQAKTIRRRPCEFRSYGITANPPIGIFTGTVRSCKRGAC